MVWAMTPQIKDGWISLEGPFGASQLRELKTFGHIERLSLTKQPLLTAAIAHGLKGVQSVEHLWLWCDTTRAAMRFVLGIPGLRNLDVLAIERPGPLSAFTDADTLEVFRCNLYLMEDDLLQI
jgi:hypothetical protein